MKNKTRLFSPIRCTYSSVSCLVYANSIESIYQVRRKSFPFFLHFRRQIDRFLARRSFYFYCFVLALMNLAEVIGTSLNIANVTIASVW